MPEMELIMDEEQISGSMTFGWTRHGSRSEIGALENHGPLSLFRNFIPFLGIIKFDVNFRIIVLVTSPWFLPTSSKIIPVVEFEVVSFRDCPG